MPRSQRGKKTRGGGSTSSDSALVASHHGAARGDYLFDSADLGRRPQSMTVNQHPPRKIQDRITWMNTSYVTSLTLPAAGSLLETNQVFSLGLIPLSSSWQALFDQYCVYSAMVRFTLEQTSTLTTSLYQGVTFGRITTAIDFDSGTAVGSESALLGFSSAIASELIPGKSYERFVKPCVTIATTQGSSTAVSGNSVSRTWMDSAFPSVPHYGIRCICQGSINPAAQTLNIQTTVVMGFRNNY